MRRRTMRMMGTIRMMGTMGIGIGMGMDRDEDGDEGWKEDRYHSRY